MSTGLLSVRESRLYYSMKAAEVHEGCSVYANFAETVRLDDRRECAGSFEVFTTMIVFVYIFLAV